MLIHSFHRKILQYLLFVIRSFFAWKELICKGILSRIVAMSFCEPRSCCVHLVFLRPLGLRLFF
ncbi:hypothetical protein PTB13_17550 [Bacillus sp. MHSD17]|nr:hypothetical protein [Bacillus sp. MHSD17]